MSRHRSVNSRVPVLHDGQGWMSVFFARGDRRRSLCVARTVCRGAISACQVARLYSAHPAQANACDAFWMESNAHCTARAGRRCCNEQARGATVKVRGPRGPDRPRVQSAPAAFTLTLHKPRRSLRPGVQIYEAGKIFLACAGKPVEREVTNTCHQQRCGWRDCSTTGPNSTCVGKRS